MDCAPEADPRVEHVLVAWFLARDRGEEPDLAELCEGDAELRARVERILEDEPSVLRELESGASGDGPDRSAPEAGRERLGEFRLIEPIGRGGMGTVYLAEQESLGRMVALKVLQAGLLVERTRLRFRREAELAASLDHPNIVPVYAIGEEDGASYIAMKRLSGPSLAEVEGALAPREVARIGVAVAGALDAAHLSGIVHRDVKPGNVILDGRTPYLVDFGLSRSQADVTLTKKGAVPGTLSFLAPELLEGDSTRLDPRVDVYALGATLYQLVAGEPPFPAEDAAQLVRQIVTKDPPPLRLRGAGRDLETILFQALEKEPERRIATARAMAEDLQRYLDGEPILARPIGPLTRALRRARRHPRATAAFAVLLLVSAVLFGLFALGRVRAERTFTEAVEVAERALGAEDHRRALEVVTPFRASRASDPRLAELVRRAEAGAALDALLDAVLNRRTAIHSEELRSRVRDVETSAASELRPRTTGLARVFAAWHLEDLEGARRIFDDLVAAGETGRVLDAVGHLLAGDGDWEPAGDELAGADDHVLTALALRLADRPLDLQLEELDRAARGGVQRRERLARAVALHGAAEHRLAREILLDLASQGDAPREVWRNLARASLSLGDVDAARQALARVPAETWTPVEGYIDLEILSWERDWEVFEERLAEYRARVARGDWTGVDILRAEAEYVGHVRGRKDEADLLLDRVQAEADDYVNRDLAAASQYLLAVNDAWTGGHLETREEVDLFEGLRDRGNELLPELRSRRARGLVSWKLGNVLAALGWAGEGLRRLEEAVELAPDVVEARVDYLSRLTEFRGVIPHLDEEFRRTRLPAGIEGYLETLAARQIEELLRSAGSSALSAENRRDLREAALRAALQIEDWPTIDRVAPELLSAEDDEERREELRAVLDEAGRKLKKLYGE